MEELAWSNFGVAKTNGVIYWAVLNIYYYILIIAKTNNYSTAIPERNARILGGDGGGAGMYVCMYVCMYVRMCTCTYVRPYVHMYVCMHARIYTHTYIYTYIQVTIE